MGKKNVVIRAGLVVIAVLLALNLLVTIACQSNNSNSLTSFGAAASQYKCVAVELTIDPMKRGETDKAAATAMQTIIEQHRNEGWQLHSCVASMGLGLILIFAK